MTKPKTKTAMTTTGDVDPNLLPAYMQDKMAINDDNFDSSDIVIPRVKLLQGLSGEVEMYDHARQGHFWHTGLDMDLGQEITFIVADRRKKYLLSAPLADGQGVLARSDDAINWDRKGTWAVKLKNIRKPVEWSIDDLNVKQSGLAEWGTHNPEDNDSPPAATLFYDYLVYMPDHPELGMAVISLARSAIRPAKKGLNDKIKMHADNGRPMQGLVFKAKSTTEQGDEGEFRGWHFQQAGFVQDEELFNTMLTYRGSLANLKIKDEDGDRTAEPESGEDGKDF